MYQSIIDLLRAHPTYTYLLPEIVLAFSALLILFLDLFVSERRKHSLAWVAVSGMVAAFFIPLITHGIYNIADVSGFAKDMVRHDSFAEAFNLIFRVSGIIVVILTLRYKPLTKRVGEMYMFLIMATTAFLFLATSVNLLMIYISIEFGTVCCYVLTAYMKEDNKSLEGALKYLLMGAVASAFLLFGISLLLGLTGSLNLDEVARVLRDTSAQNRELTLVIFVFVLTGFGIKIAMVPFHFWCPEAYEGAPTPVTVFLSVTPKAAGVAVLLRVCLTLFHGVEIPWVQIIQVLAIVTMTVANVIGLWQTNIKRLMAYSSIAHVGYLLIGLVVAGSLGLSDPLGRQGLFASMFYITAYAFMNYGVFAVIIAVSNALDTDEIKNYAGLGKRAPFMAVALTVFLLSQAGIPPTVGFIGKFFLLKSAVEAGYYLLAFALVVNSIIGVYYYWNIVRTMFIEEPTDPARVRTAGPIWAVTAVLIVVVLGLGLFFQNLLAFIMNSSLQV